MKLYVSLFLDLILLFPYSPNFETHCMLCEMCLCCILCAYECLLLLKAISSKLTVVLVDMAQRVGGSRIPRQRWMGTERGEMDQPSWKESCHGTVSHPSTSNCTRAVAAHVRLQASNSTAH